MKNTFFAVMMVSAAGIASAQTTYRLERVPVVEEIQCTGYKKVLETQFAEETVTAYETVWETEQKERRYTVARKVPETSFTERRYTVQKPFEETVIKDTSYDFVRTVPETSMREERYFVSKQVMDIQERQVYETRRVPEQETTIENRTYTVNRPVTNYVETVVDRGKYVSQVNTLPGQTYSRLAWHRANYVDPVSGESKWRVPGFYWTDMQGPTRYEANRVYQPNYVAQTVPVTSTVQEQRVEQVPVTRTTYRDEQVVRTEQVQVPRTVLEEVVRQVPVTTYKQITERVERQTPVTVRRMVPEEIVEQVPVTSYKTVLENVVEPYEVRVAKVVPVTRTVQKPITTVKWVPYTYTMERQRMEVRRIPVETAPDVTSVVPKSTPAGKPSSDPADKIPTLPKSVETE